jgi:tetratricopeptide (TPR) repeat protein
MEQEWPTRVAREVSVVSTISAFGVVLTLVFGAFSGSWMTASIVLVICFAITAWLHRTTRVTRFTLFGSIVVLIAALAAMSLYREPDDAKTAPTSSAAHALDSAIALGKNGHVDEAIDALRRLITQEPTNAPAMANLCGFELQAGRIATAAATCRDAAALAPTNWLAHYNEACAFALRARPEAALASLRLALDLVQDDPRAHVSRAALAKQARSDEMLRILHGTPPFVALVDVR